MLMKCHENYVLENSSINSSHLYSAPPSSKELKYDTAQQITWNEEFTDKLQRYKTHQIYY